MHALLKIAILLAGGVAAFWVLLRIYGLVRKDRPEDKKRKSRTKLTETGTGSDSMPGSDG